MEIRVGLDKLSKYLEHTHLKLNLDFLYNLLKDASNSSSPHRNIKFINLLGCYFNEPKKSSPTIFGWIKGYRTMPMNKLLIILKNSNFSWSDLENNLIYLKSGIRNGEIKPSFPIVFGYKLGSIVGHILGDGSIDKVNHALFYSNSNVNLIREFGEYVQSIFGVKPRIWVQERRKFEEKTKWLKRVYNVKEIPEKHNVGLFCPKICSDILYAICGKFAEGKNKKITDEIINSSKSFKRGLIRAFFDDEGSIDDKSYMVRFHQDNKSLLRDLKFIISEFGIRSQPIRKYIKRNKPRYYFNITSFKEYSLFFEIFGCTSPEKARKFELLIDKVKKSKNLS